MAIRRAFVVLVAVVGISSAPSGALATDARPSVQTVAHYSNCTAMNRLYRHGVGKPGARDHVSGRARPVTNFYKNLALYNANKGRDRDGDGIACEKL
jgi:hypothetical protein